MGARLSALKKILGESAGRMGGLTSELGQAAKGTMASGRHAMAGGMNMNALKALKGNLGVDLGRAGSAIAKAPGEAALLGAGGLGAGYAGKKGIEELLEELGLSDDEDMEMGEDPHHAMKARAMRGGAM